MANLKTILSLLLVFSLLFVSCSKDKEKERELGAVDFPFEAVMQFEVSLMMISVQRLEGEFRAFLVIFLLDDHQTVALKINGNNVALDQTSGSYSSILDLLPGQNITYELNIDGKKRSGSLAIPDAIQASFSPEFNLETDYSLSWITDDPTGFITFLDINLFDDWVTNAVFMNGTHRSYTFSRNMYSDLTEDEIDFIDVGVLGINFDIKDDMVFMAGFEDYKVYEFDEPSLSRNAKPARVEEPRSGFQSFLLKRYRTNAQ